MFSLNTVVKVRKNDVKVRKVSDQLTNIVRYAFQNLVSEGAYATELRQGKHDVIDLCKQALFRNQLMMLVEGSLMLAGLNQYASVIGNNISVEIKLSRHSLMVFEVCKHFQLIIYEMPYINLPAQGLIKASLVNETIQGSQVQVKVTTEHAYVADAKLQIMPAIMESALKDVCIWFVESQGKDTPYLKKLEVVLLSLVYDRFDAKANGDYNWHVVLSDLHDPREQHMHQLSTNHSQLVYAADCILKDKIAVAENYDLSRPLRYHHQLKAAFQIDGKMKQVFVIVWNQKYEAVSSVELLYRGGFRTVVSNWRQNLCSLQGASVIFLMLMFALILLGGRTCDRVNKERELNNAQEMTMFETMCSYQQLAVGQVAIAVLVLAVLKQLIPRARQAGLKRTQREQTQAKKEQ